MGKSTISMAIFDSYVSLPEGKIRGIGLVVVGFYPVNMNKKTLCSEV